MKALKKEFETATNPKLSTEIRIVDSESERQRVYAFRYSTYVEGMGRDMKVANHEKKILTDRLDTTAIIVAAYCGDEIIGTGRINFSYDTEFGEEELYGFEAFESMHPGKLSLTSKVMVREDFRGTFTFLEMAKKFFELSYENGIEVNFIATGDHLVRLFERLGFQKYRGRFEWLDYGSSNPMLLEMNNIEHLKRVRSPFVSLLEKQIAERSVRIGQNDWPKLKILTPHYFDF